MYHLTKNKSGITLVEILIAVVIAAFIAGAFLTVLRSTGTQITHSSEHFTAFFLAQKVSQDLSEEIRINPHAFSRLGIDSNLQVSTQITDGQSIFFTTLEFGPDNSPRDLDSSMQPLYNQVSPFNLTVSSQNSPPSIISADARKNLFKVQTELQWAPQHAGTGLYTTRGYFFAPIQKPAFESFDDLEISINDCFNYFQNAPPTNSYPTTPPESLAKIHYIIGAMTLDSPDFHTLLEDLQSLRNNLAAIPLNNFNRLHDTHWELAQKWYELAGVIMFHFMLLKDDFTNVNMPELATDNALRRIPKNCAVVYELLYSSLNNSKYHFYKLLESNIARQKGVRRKNQVMTYLMNIHRAMVTMPMLSTMSSAPETEYIDFLTSIQSFSSNTSPGWNRYAQQELELISSQQLINNYPQLEDISQILNNVTSFIISGDVL